LFLHFLSTSVSVILYDCSLYSPASRLRTRGMDASESVFTAQAFSTPLNWAQTLFHFVVYYSAITTPCYTWYYPFHISSSAIFFPVCTYVYIVVNSLTMNSPLYIYVRARRKKHSRERDMKYVAPSVTRRVVMAE
jgi:hypothetical protein